MPRGEPGELVIRGYAVMRGYLDDESETAATIDDDGWLHTGDIAEMDDAGYVRITDRTKDMFIVGRVQRLPGRDREPDAGQRVHRPGGGDRRSPTSAWARWAWPSSCPAPGSTIDPDELIAWSRERMANYKAPRRVEVVDALPLNASGKVLKYELRDRATSEKG